MGETEGKKDEADYKRLQTFPLVRVRPRGGRQGGQQGPQSLRERQREPVPCRIAVGGG